MLLGYQDSNLEWLNQNQLCCQLHHTPLAACNRWSQAVFGPNTPVKGQLTCHAGPTCRLPKIPRRPPHASSAAVAARSRPALSRCRLRSRPSSSSDSNSGGLIDAPVAATRMGPNALRGLSAKFSNSATLRASSILSVLHSSTSSSALSAASSTGAASARSSLAAALSSSAN